MYVGGAYTPSAPLVALAPLAPLGPLVPLAALAPLASGASGTSGTCGTVGASRSEWNECNGLHPPFAPFCERFAEPWKGITKSLIILCLEVILFANTGSVPASRTIPCFVRAYMRSHFSDVYRTTAKISRHRKRSSITTQLLFLCQQSQSLSSITKSPSSSE